MACVERAVDDGAAFDARNVVDSSVRGQTGGDSTPLATVKIGYHLLEYLVKIQATLHVVDLPDMLSSETGQHVGPLSHDAAPRSLTLRRGSTGASLAV